MKSSTVAALRLYFPCLSRSSVTKHPSFVSNSGKRLQIHIKFLELFTEMKHCLVRVSAGGLKDSERDVSRSTTVDEVRDRQLLEIQKQW